MIESTGKEKPEHNGTTEDADVSVDPPVDPTPDPATESIFVTHARSELPRLGNDDDFNNCIIEAIQGFLAYAHSGTSFDYGIDVLTNLLHLRNLTPITNDPSEWVDRSELTGYPIWQSIRNAEAFSRDGGKTYWLLSENVMPHTAADPSEVTT